MDITKLGVIETLVAIKDKKFNIQELVGTFIKKIKDDPFNTFITNNFDNAIERAKLLDQKKEFGKLHGVTIAVKDVFCTKGLKTTCGSKMLSNFVPEYESTVTNKLLQEGAIIIGKTNMDEFSMGSSGLTSAFGATLNPLKDKTRPDTKLVPGGSSSGSVVSVLADYCNASIGGDTGGSIKQPAALCGVVGVRPTYGRCSRHGLIAFSSSLDQPGVFAKNVSDAAYMLEIMSGYDSNDSTTLKANPMSILGNIDNLDCSNLKVGLIKECKSNSVLPSILNTWEKVAKFLESKGATIVNVSVPNMNVGAEVYYTIATAEAFSNLSRFDGVKYGYRTDRPFKDLNEMYKITRSEGFGSEVKRRIAIGAHVLSHEHYEDSFIKAAKIRTLLVNDFKEVFNGVDILLLPVTPNVAFGFDDKHSPISMYLNDIFTIPSNLAGLAGISVPAGIDNDTGLPIGMQLIPKAFDELKMFQVAKLIETGIKNGEL